MPSTAGFKTDFIAPNLVVDFPTLTDEQLSDLVHIGSPGNPELTYPHFSLYLSKSRRFPYFTATNIDGGLFKRINRDDLFPSGKDEWTVDSRAADYQWGASLYSAAKSDFQRGHMTKREDPQWGNTVEEAKEAARATFHFSNCVPQMGELNTQEWGKLETYILSEESVPDKLKVSVLTGPVLRSYDPIFVTPVEGQEVAIPTLFWKIVYYTDDGKRLSRAAFLMGQENVLYEQGIVVQKATENIVAVAEARAAYFQDFEDAAIYQVNMATIETLTQLRFAPAFEPYQDERPLKLIIEKVQVEPGFAPPEGLDAMAIDEETDQRVIFPNMRR